MVDPKPVLWEVSELGIRIIALCGQAGAWALRYFCFNRTNQGSFSGTWETKKVVENNQNNLQNE